MTKNILRLDASMRKTGSYSRDCIRPASHRLDRGFDPRYSWRRWKQTRTKKQ